MLVSVATGFIAALVAPLIHARLRRISGWILALVPAVLFLYFASHINTVAHGEIVSISYSWVSSLDVELVFALDGLSLLLALIITGIGTLIVIYGGGYLADDVHQGRFYSFTLIFMAAMIGLVLSDNLLILYVFWELTSVSSYLLIGYKHQYDDSRKSALTALIVTGSGGLAMLAGFVMLGLTSGSWNISELVANRQAVQEHTLYFPILILIGIGAFTKSAQFPFHFWLPGAMAAPTPVSAYLHSATMVKAGVFLLARMSPLLAGTIEWQLLVTGVGVITMLVGAYLSIKQTDLKRILAYSTVSSLGIMVMLLGWGTRVSVEAAMLFVLVHSLYKGALFMIAGAVDHETGTRDIRELGGLFRVMPLIGLAAALASLSMSGIPPFLGFVGKELIYEATLAYETGTALHLQAGEILLTLMSVLGNMATITVACLVAIVPFAGKISDTPKHPHRAPLSLWLGPFILASLALAMGVLPGMVGEKFVAPAATATYGEFIDLHLALWHGITPMLILSIITVAGGVMIFWQRKAVIPILNRFDPGAQVGPDNSFSILLDRLPDLATSITRVFQNGHLRYYVITIITTTIGILVFTIATRVDLPDLNLNIEVRLYEFIIACAMLLGVSMVLLSRHLLFTVTALGVIGYGSALIFVLFGAPDLAMTQFAIETLSVILFVLVLYRLPQLAHLSSRRSRIRDAVIASTAGGIVTAVVLVITSRPLNSKLTDFFSTASYLEAQGRNIVNVILVDFRGFDTMGEITVLAIAAIGVFALLKLRVRPSAANEQTADEKQGEHS